MTVTENETDGRRTDGAVDARVLGQLLYAMPVLEMLPTAERIAEFLTAALSDIPGVRTCVVRLGEAAARGGEPHQRADPAAGPTPSCVHLTVPVETGGEVYGDFALVVDDEPALKPYLPFFTNLAGSVALLTENRLRRDRLEAALAAVRERRRGEEEPADGTSNPGAALPSPEAGGARAEESGAEPEPREMAPRQAAAPGVPDGNSRKQGELDPRAVGAVAEFEREFGREAVTGLLSSFLTDTPPRLAGLRQLATGLDRQALGVAAHALAGSCSLFGLGTMRELGLALEEMVENPEEVVTPEACLNQVAALEREYAPARLRLEQELERLQIPDGPPGDAG